MFGLGANLSGGSVAMSIQVIIGAALCVALAGCTHHQLARSTVLATGTVMDIQYRTVLNNLALMSCHPEALPSHIDLADGVVQVSDEAAFGTSGGFTTLGGNSGSSGTARPGAGTCPSSGAPTRSPTRSG